MKSTILVMICGMVFWSSSMAQEQLSPILERPFTAVTFDLLSPFYPKRLLSSSASSPHLTRWRLGYRHQVNQRWAIGADFGYGNKKLALLKEREDYRLYEFRPELLYLLQQKSRTKVYFSLQPFYILHKETLVHKSVFAQDIGSVRFDQADYKRTKYGLTLNYGFLFPISSSMRVNVYIGGGLKRRLNKYESFVNPTLDPYHENHFPPYYDSDIPLTDFEFSFGVKACFLVHKK
ncbi:MAG: hypothetical protein VX798_15335 [Bacteroidota bacterium]|nr:hypothetical protein [Bacteroidota bacterium]